MKIVLALLFLTQLVFVAANPPPGFYFLYVPGSGYYGSNLHFSGSGSDRVLFKVDVVGSYMTFRNSETGEYLRNNNFNKGMSWHGSLGNREKFSKMDHKHQDGFHWIKIKKRNEEVFASTDGDLWRKGAPAAWIRLVPYGFKEVKKEWVSQWSACNNGYKEQEKKHTIEEGWKQTVVDSWSLASEMSAEIFEVVKVGLSSEYQNSIEEARHEFNYMETSYWIPPGCKGSLYKFAVAGKLNVERGATVDIETGKTHYEISSCSSRMSDSQCRNYQGSMVLSTVNVKGLPKLTDDSTTTLENTDGDAKAPARDYPGKEAETLRY